jgi:hypothetical protein
MPAAAAAPMRRSRCSHAVELSTTTTTTTTQHTAHPSRPTLPISLPKWAFSSGLIQARLK